MKSRTVAIGKDVNFCVGCAVWTYNQMSGMYAIQKSAHLMHKIWGWWSSSSSNNLKLMHTYDL